MVRLRIAMSLDGYVAGPEQSLDHPLGRGGMRLHEWMFPLKAFREMQGMEGGEENESSQVVAEWMRGVGATIMGHHMFGGHVGGPDWRGWWGENPPFHHPVFVLTHRPRASIEMQGGTTFHFVSDGIESALKKAVACGGDVAIGGGADTARQYLRAGLVDELLIHLAPVVLGAGERLFDGVSLELKLVRTVAASNVTHLYFAR